MVNASLLTLIPVLPGRDERVQKGSHKTFHPRLTCFDDGGYAVEPRLRDFLKQIEGIMQNLNWCSTKKPSCRLMCDTFKLPAPRLKEVRMVEALLKNRKARKGFLVIVLTEHTMQNLHNSIKTLHHANGSVRGECSHLGPDESKGLCHVNDAAEPLYMNHVGEDTEEPLEASKLVKLSWFGYRACFNSTQNSVHQR